MCRKKPAVVVGHNDITKIVFHATSPPLSKHSLCVYKLWVEGKSFGAHGCLGYFSIMCLPFGLSPLRKTMIKLFTEIHHSTPLHHQWQDSVNFTSSHASTGQPSPTNTLGGCYGSKLSESHSLTQLFLFLSPCGLVLTAAHPYLDKQFSSAAHLRLYIGTLWA